MLHLAMAVSLLGITMWSTVYDAKHAYGGYDEGKRKSAPSELHAQAASPGVSCV